MKVHLIGIGGVGMAGLAVLLKEQGHEVTGCDVFETSRTRWLVSLGIPVFLGHSPAHLSGVDEVIVTPAVDRNNPERMAAAGLWSRFRGEVLAEIVRSRETIAVCGSHGKTTTATWIARLLKGLGEDVAWCIGGETGQMPVAGVGKGPLVVEADESDGTLALYQASVLVVNKCEYDHPDYFPTEEAYFACFEKAKRQAGAVVESENLPPIAELDDVLVDLPPHNRRNARAAVEVALRRGHALADIIRELPDVVSRLPDRRFQKVWPREKDAPIAVYTDYAHHPTEMRCAVEMARSRCSGKLRVLFQPHRYSRTKALLPQFPAAFTGADEVVLCPTYAAFERPIEGGDIADLYACCRKASMERPSPTFHLARSVPEAWEHARNVMAAGDITLLLGAGDIICLVPRVQDDLRRSALRPPDTPLRRVWIGAGTNTWKSDLMLNVEYVRTEGPAGRPGATLGIPWMAGIPARLVAGSR